MLDLLPIGVTSILDVLLVWLLIWAGIVWLRASPARVALTGLAFLGVVYLLARQIGLVVITWILQGFFAVSVLVAVVVFQQELRRLFEQIASIGLGRVGRDQIGIDFVDTVVRALARLASQHHGALIVIPGAEPLARHLDGGVQLEARISEPLLLSIFDPHSPGHDGALLIDQGRALRFAVHLPLSNDHAQLDQLGTRHAAALGLCERTDALCIVVSEERGTISIAHAGRLEAAATAQDAGKRMRAFMRDLTPGAEYRVRAMRRITGSWREALIALPLALGLWLLAVPGSSQVEIERELPIRVTGLPEGVVLKAVEPPRAHVQLSGRRRDLLLLDTQSLEVRVDAILVELGRRSFPITAENVVRPATIDVVSIEPTQIKIQLEGVVEQTEAD